MCMCVAGKSMQDQSSALLMNFEFTQKAIHLLKIFD